MTKKFRLQVILVAILSGVISSIAVLIIFFVGFGGFTKLEQIVNSSSISTQQSNGSSATNAYNKIKNSVVTVENLQNYQPTATEILLYGDRDTGGLQTAAEGSGIIFQQKDGTEYVVTNEHVIDGAQSVKLILSDGKEVDASIIGSDTTADIAVLKTNSSSDMTTADFADSSKIQTGQFVLAVGSPLGSAYATSMTQGIISSPSRKLQTDNSTSGIEVIQTDAAINPGNSGGPLINESGQVVGINSMKLTQSESGESVEGIGFAIPSNRAQEVIKTILKQQGINL